MAVTLPSALEWGVHWLCKLGWKDASAVSSLDASAMSSH